MAKLHVPHAASSSRRDRAGRWLPAAIALLGLTLGLMVAALDATATDGPAQAASLVEPIPRAEAALVLDPSAAPTLSGATDPDASVPGATSADPPSPEPADPPASAAPDGPASLPSAAAISTLQLDPAAAVLITDRVAIERPLSTLAPRAVDFLATRKGRVSVAVFDLRDGTAYYYGREQRYELVSVGKVAILVTVLERAHMGRRQLNELESRQLQRMITLSDNDATTDVWRRAGRVSGIGGILNRIGLGGARIDVIAEDWGGMTATATDVALLFAEVGDGRVLSEESRGQALTLLESIGEEQRWGVTAGFSGRGGTGDRLAFKNGWWLYPDSLGWAVHSAGVVSDAEGNGRYAVAVLSDGQPTHPYGIETIEGIAREIHRVLSPLNVSPLTVAFWR